MKKCPFCGSEIMASATTCAYCNSVIDSSVNSDTVVSEAPVSFSQPKTNTLALTSMILGITAIPLLCCCYIGVIPGILAVIFGFMARNKISQSLGQEKGDGMALAGIILGFVSIGLAALLIIFSLTSVFNSNEFMDEFRRQMELNRNGR